jgi:hypothetical protein
LKLVLLAYAESADANETLAEAYLADGENKLARQHAEKASAILDSHRLPASSWTDMEQYRGEIRRGAGKVLKQLSVGSYQPSLIRSQRPQSSPLAIPLCAFAFGYLSGSFSQS